MRKFISGLLAIAAAAFTGCYESGTDADNTSREARISISPAAIGFDADGRTTDGLAFGTYIVTVNPYGKMYSDWHAELVGTDWATLDYHTASPDGAVEKALRITCSANTDYKRTGTLRVTLSKTGESVDFPITQVGLKPDATLTLSTESDIEMMALEPAEVTVTFETNMPASTVTAELEEGVEWLTCTLDREAGTVVLAASDNTSPTDMREATVTVSAGTEDTSLATRQIKVRQLANETYLFIYGSGIPHFAAFGDAAQMNKNDLVFGLDHYFRSGKVILSTSRTPDAYPRYALTADGKLAVLADAAAEAAAPELTPGPRPRPGPKPRRTTRHRPEISCWRRISRHSSTAATSSARRQVTTPYRVPSSARRGNPPRARTRRPTATVRSATGRRSSTYSPEARRPSTSKASA